ncbi:MAG TPA: hypothetical protein DCZ72_05145 [Armatimonadetes bacterium]|nr:hypothetical protein [Armatimonadota bacterium]
MDSHSVTTTESWGSRLGKSIVGVGIGILLFLGSFAVLYAGEGRAVNRAKALNEGQSVAITVGSDAVDAANEGKLVHTTGRATTEETVTDPDLGVALNSLSLRRRVEMYQWTESKKEQKRQNLGGSETTVTTYTYNKEWLEKLEDSNDFNNPNGHHNPDSKPFDTGRFNAEAVNVGAFTLSADQINRLGGAEEYTPDPALELPEAWRDRATIAGKYIYVRNALNEPNRVPGSTNERDPAKNPQVGDLRVSYEQVPAHDISVLASQVGSSFAPHSVKHGSIDELADSTKSLEEMFTTARQENTILTWLIRLVGFLMMAGGLAMVFGPLSVLTSVLPFMGRIVGAGTGLAAILIAAPLSVLTIAIAWLRFRPILGIVLLAVAGFLGYYARGKIAARSGGAGASAGGDSVGAYQPLDVDLPSSTPRSSGTQSAPPGGNEPPKKKGF